MTVTTETQVDMQERKHAMRRAAYDARNATQDKDRISEVAVNKFVQLPEYQQSQSAMWYIDCRSELRTKHALDAALASGKRIIVPYCTEDEQGQNKLGLFWLEDMSELVVGKWNILEPPRDLWGDDRKEVHPAELDIVMVPGVGFGRDGSRMGNGQGYYDRLLERVRAECPLIGLCYESQLFDDLIVSEHDVYMDKVVTESAVYDGKGRS